MLSGLSRTHLDGVGLAVWTGQVRHQRRSKNCKLSMTWGNPGGNFPDDVVQASRSPNPEAEEESYLFGDRPRAQARWSQMS
jgi:hypothetical protein